jgi:NADPH-dependent ferric siderophore reductase
MARKALAKRLGIGAYELEINEIMDLAPSVRRIRVGAAAGDTLAEFSFQAGQDLMLDVERDGESTTRRRYTIRRFDRARQLIDLDVVLHGEGPAARWAANATPGCRLGAIGPRGKVTLDQDATWHLFVGDETFVPAVGAMLDALGSGGRAVAVLEVDSAEDARGLRADFVGGDGIIVRFLERKDRPVGDASALLTALSEIDTPSDSRHAYVAGEHRVVGAIRKALASYGFTNDEVSPKAYWRLGQANADHGEPTSDD